MVGLAATSASLRKPRSGPNGKLVAKSYATSYATRATYALTGPVVSGSRGVMVGAAFQPADDDRRSGLR